MLDESRGVATAHALSCEQQIIARSSGDAAKLQLARIGRAVQINRGCGNGKPHIFLKRLSHDQDRPLHLFALFHETRAGQFLNFVERRQQLRLRRFDSMKSLSGDSMLV